MGLNSFGKVHQQVVISSHASLAIIINGTSWYCLGCTIRSCLYPLRQSSSQTNRCLSDFLPNFFAGASFNASFIDGLRVMVSLWPIQFSFWKASMSLHNLYLQISAPHQASGHNPDAGHPFHRGDKVGIHLTGLTYQGPRVRVLAIPGGCNPGNLENGVQRREG
jgi:hypothetical protein